MAKEKEGPEKVGKDERMAFLVFDHEEAVGVPTRLYKTVSYKDLVKGIKDDDDEDQRGYFILSNASLPNPISNKTIQLTAGSETVKALGWAQVGEEDNGLYRTAANIYLWSHSSTSIFKIEGTGLTLYGTTTLSGQSSGAGSLVFTGANAIINQSTAGESLFVKHDSDTRLELTATETLLNSDADAADRADVRVLSANLTHMLFVDVSADMIGINTSAPRKTLDILHASAAQLRLTQADNSKYVDLLVDSSSTLSVRPEGTERAAFKTTELAVNDGQADYDFRVEGDNTANLLFVDASADKVGVNQASPGCRLHVTESTVGDEVFRIESTATNDDPADRFYHGRIATTDATVTTINTIAIPASTTVYLEAHVRARRTGGTAGTAEDGAGYCIKATYKNVAGTATLIGAVLADYTAEDQAAWDATFSVSSGNALLRVTGALDNSVSWHSTVIYRAVGS